MDLLARIFGRETSRSKNIAKERLRLVLVHDRSSLSPQLLESMKEDIIKVISNYVDIDRRGTEVTLNSDEHSVALIASIPITRINRGSR